MVMEVVDPREQKKFGKKGGNKSAKKVVTNVVNNKFVAANVNVVKSGLEKGKDVKHPIKKEYQFDDEGSIQSQRMSKLNRFGKSVSKKHVPQRSRE